MAAVVQFEALTPLADSDGMSARWVIGRITHRSGGGRSGEATSDGIALFGAQLTVEVKRGVLADGEAIRYNGQYFRIEGVAPQPPHFVVDHVFLSRRAKSDLHDARVLMNRRLDNELGILVTVALHRRTGSRSTVTGALSFAAPVNVKAKIMAADSRDIEDAGSIDEGTYVVTLYGTAADVGDRIVWGGQNHTVTRVAGLVKDAAGDFYGHRVTTN